MAIALPQGLSQQQIEGLRAMQFNVEKTDAKNAPKPKQSVATIQPLADALAALKKGTNILVSFKDVTADITRVHVQRAGKARTDVKFVTRTEKDKGLRVYAV